MYVHIDFTPCDMFFAMPLLVEDLVARGLEQMVKSTLSDGLKVCNIPKAWCLHHNCIPSLYLDMPLQEWAYLPVTTVCFLYVCRKMDWSLIWLHSSAEELRYRLQLLLMGWPCQATHHP